MTPMRSATRRGTVPAALLAAALLLTGCGGGSDTSDATAGSGPSPTSGALGDVGSGQAGDRGDRDDRDDRDDRFDDDRIGTAGDDTPLRGEVRQRAVRAALAEVDGRVTEATYADRDERHVYEVEVEQRDDDVTVELDRSFRVTRVDR